MTHHESPPAASSRSQPVPAQAPTARSRSPQAVEEYCRFYRQEFASLCRFLYHRGAAVDSVSDLAQEAMEELWLQWGTVYAPRSWIRVVASRKCAASRTAAREAQALLPRIATDEGGVDEHAHAAFGLSAEEAHVLRVLRQLPDRQALVMAWTLDGYTPAEIAARINSTAGAVRKALFDARNALKLRGLGIGETQ